MSTVIYPGSFDPVTYGHMDIINRASKLFDNVIVGVFENSSKKCLFSKEDRLQMLYAISPLLDSDNVKFVAFDGLLADFAKENKVDAVIRGLRAVSDFEYEFQMALTNRKLNHKLETIFIPSREDYTYLSSSTVKTVSKYGGDVSDFVPPAVSCMLRLKLREEF